MIDSFTPDFTQHPPRSPRVRLGGFVHLPRFLDKARASAAGTLGAYIFPAPLDERMLELTGLSSDAVIAAVKEGKSDTEMLAWIHENAPNKLAPHEIAAWSHWLENLGTGSVAGYEGIAKRIAVNGPNRNDIRTFFDNLDLDDYVSFGGKG